MLVLGLDPSLCNYGWLLLDTDKDLTPIARGQLHTPAKKLFIDRYVYLREELSKLLNSFKPDKVGIEYPIFGTTFSEGMYGLFLYSCEALRQYRSDVVYFTNTQTKAYVKRYLDLPSGWKITKSEIIKAAKLITNEKKKWSSDEADAFFMSYLASYFWKLREGSIEVESLTPYLQEVFVTGQGKGKKAKKGKKDGLLYQKDKKFFLWSELPILG
jgi:Holliday junction resolvasome RuvABC endonuclease subunit